MSTVVFVCRKCDGGSRLVEQLDGDGVRVRPVGCQKICADHVVGVRCGGALVWFRRVDSKPRRTALRRYIASGGDVVPGRLRRLTVPKRAGRLRT